MPGEIIQPRVLKGFRDLLPQVAIPRVRMLDQIRSVFDGYGYVPIETPALEYTEILLGKGSDETDKQLYRFRDQGDRDIALRFDLTVPLARFAAMYANDLGTPFRRYHIAPVWRAEKPQRGRFREFTQCDFDIIGTRSPLADAEIIALINSIFTRLNISHRIRVNHRAVLNGFMEKIGAVGKTTSVLRAIDKLEKLGKETVAEELAREAGLNSGQIEQAFDFLAISGAEKTASRVLDAAKKICSGNALAEKGISELTTIISALSDGGADLASIAIDLSIARGLDYYTGPVFETQAADLPDIGSICSGGRYDNLASLYSKRDLPGVGSSVGLDRTLAVLEELGRIEAKGSTAEVLICLLDEGTAGALMGLAQMLRREGISTELYPEFARLGNQLKYADRKSIGYAVIAGTDEAAARQCSLKQLASGEQWDKIPFDRLAAVIKEKLNK